MKRSWTCPRCHLVFSRKWNLQRHLKLTHSTDENSGSIDSALGFPYDNKQTGDNTLSIIEEPFKQVANFGDLLNKINRQSNAAGYQNSLRLRIKSLQQQVASCEKRFSDLVSYNWLFPRRAIQGISGYLCRKCQTFSFKVIFDPGYDRTMESRHQCAESDYKRSYMVIPIPPEISDVDDWVAKYLLDQVNYYIPIGKYLIATNMSKCFNDFSNNLNPEITRGILGIPDRYPLYSFENNRETIWVYRAIDNLDKKIIMGDSEILDFFKRAKSTYAFFEIPVEGTVRQYFMYFTN